MTKYSRTMWMAATALLLCGVLMVGCGPSGDGDGSGGGGGASSDGSADGSSADGSNTDGAATDGTSDSATTGTTDGGAAASGGWGDLKGRFVYDGKSPDPMAIAVTKDVEVCGKHKLFNESLVVNPENSGIKNVIVYLYLSRGEKAPAAHPSYAETAEQEVRLENFNCRFDPHVTLLRTTQPFVIGNKDPVGHNTKINMEKNESINPIVSENNELPPMHLSNAEPRPVPVSCSIHPWMTGMLFVSDNPYMAVSDDNGNFEIKNLPAGDWTMQVNHEGNSIQQVNVGGEDKEWKRGRVDVKIGGGTLDWGDVKVKPDTFK